VAEHLHHPAVLRVHHLLAVELVVIDDRDEIRRKKSSVPRNSGGVTPTIVSDRRLTSTVLPMTLGSS
jgi:hypothetical protein